MAAIARIVVISAVFYLLRFALAHQHQTRSKYSDVDSTYSLQEDSVSTYEDSNEKVLIRSGVPLRGRTIHQTAWSEEEKVSAPVEDTLPQPDDQNTKENLSEGWSFTNAINYILSFIYDTGIGEDAIISNNQPENSKENFKLSKMNLDETKTHQNTIKMNDSKEKSKNIPVLKKNKVLEAMPHYPIGNLPNQDVLYKELFSNDISSLGDEYTYSEYDAEKDEFSIENSDSEYEEVSYKLEDYDMINKGMGSEMHGISSVIANTKDDTMRKNLSKPFNVFKEKKPKFVSVAKSQESDQERDQNALKKYLEDDMYLAGNTKTDFGLNDVMDYKEYDNNILQSTNRPPKQQSKSEIAKDFIETGSYSESSNSPSESLSVEDISTEKSMKEDKMQGKIHQDGNDGENIYATTRRASFENIINEIPPTTLDLQNQGHPKSKELLPKSVFPTKTEKPKVIMDKNKQERNYEANRLFATTANFNEQQHEKGFKNPNYVTKTPAEFTDHTQTNRQIKTSSNDYKREINIQSASMPDNKSLITPIMASQFPNEKSLKDRDQERLKSKQWYLNDVYLDLEPDSDVRSYNYLLDSYEFIKVDKNNNKVNEKHDNSFYVIIQDKEHGFKNGASTTSSPPLTSFKDQREVEVVDKPQESFDTILEYLYKNSNNSFILSLRAHNSSEI